MKFSSILKSLAVVVFSCVLAGTALADATIAYPTADDASFLITAPDDWELDPADEPGGYFDLNGPTGATFSFRTIKGTESSLQEAIMTSFAEIGEFYSDLELQEPADWTPNGLTGFFAGGAAKDKEDGSTVFLGMGWCALEDGKIAEMWFVANIDDKEGIEQADKIANSLRNP